MATNPPELPERPSQPLCETRFVSVKESAQSGAQVGMLRLHLFQRQELIGPGESELRTFRQMQTPRQMAPA
jgi:hypothetical protein